MGNFLFPVNGADLVQCLNGGRQAAVHAEDLRNKEGTTSTEHEGAHVKKPSAHPTSDPIRVIQSSKRRGLLTLPSMMAERDR